MVTTKEFFYIRIFTLKRSIMLGKKNNIISPMLILLALMAFLTACTASQSVSEQKRAGKGEQVSTVVQNALNSKHFTLNVNNMYPVSASSKYVGGEFFLEVKGDTLRSYLPYFGAVYHSSYNMGNALDFEQKMESFQQVRKKKNCTTIYISVRTAEDFFKYTLNIFDNGRFDLYVLPVNRQSISYDGELKF